MNKEIIIQNPWWKTKEVPVKRTGKIKRACFNEIEKELGDEKVTCLLGPRRAGKTTIIYKLISCLIKKGVDPKRIIYISLDNSKVRLELTDEFDDVIRDYISTILKERTDNLSSKIYIFLDEIHKLDGWGDKVKHWQDMQLNIKFIVSGSSSVRILKGSGESLLGRINYHTILSLSFSEFSGYSLKGDLIDNLNNLMNFKYIKHLHDNLILEKENILILLDDYLQKGGFPEIRDMNYEDAYELLRIYKTLTVNRDILDIKDIKEPRNLSDLLDLLSDFMSQRINYSTFSNILKIKVDTVKNYITYFEECYMVYNSYVYSKRHIISTRKEKKLFFIDHGLRNALLLKEIDKKERAKLMENLVFAHIFRKKSNELFPKIFYWTDKNKNEVDVVAVINKKTIPIEIKYTDRVTKTDLRGLKKFIKEFNVDKGFVITKDLLKEEDDIIYIPAWLFLLD